MVRLPGDPPGLDFGRQRFVATGTPGGGIYTWPSPAETDKVRHPLASAPGNVDRAVYDGTEGDSGIIRVEYTCQGVIARAQVEVPVDRKLCSEVRWQPFGGNVTPGQPLKRCQHPGRYHNDSDYGGRCEDCSGGASGTRRDVYHEVPRVHDSHDCQRRVINLGNELIRYIRTSHVEQPWVEGVDQEKFFLSHQARVSQGKMIGVLVGSNVNGVHVLRAISGMRQVFLRSERVNPYWSPPLHRHHTIPSATRGGRYYPEANPQGATAGDWATFGKCAATALLSHALALGLEVHCMAEAFIFPGNQHSRRDADSTDIVPSCHNCRRYLGRMLCEYGGGPRTNAYTSVPVPPNRGLS